MDMGYTDPDRLTRSILQRFDSNPHILDSNKKVIARYVSYMKANNLNPRTISKNLYCFENFFNTLNKETDLLQLSREDVESSMAKINTSKYSEKTKSNIKVVVKSFYKHFLGEDLYYPKIIAWIKTTNKKANKVLPEDILQEDDVLKMLDNTTNLRDKAIISLLFDSGVRIGELCGLRIKDVDLASDPPHIRVDGKTGMRQIPILFSAPYLGAYIETLKNKKQNDYLWVDLGTWSNKDRNPEYGAIRMMLRRIAAKAGISKSVRPHAWRHARATNYANKLTEQQLKVFFGWTGDSRMASTYVHLSGRDIDNAVLKANGIKTQDNMMETKLKSKICPKCKFTNGSSMSYCGRCGSALDIRTAVEDRQMVEFMRMAFENPRLKDQFKRMAKGRK